MSLDYVDNPVSPFRVVVFDETTTDPPEPETITGGFVRVHVRDDSRESDLKRFIGALNEAQPSNLQVVERTRPEEETRERTFNPDDTLGVMRAYVNLHTSLNLRKPVNEELVRLHAEATEAMS